MSVKRDPRHLESLLRCSCDIDIDIDINVETDADIDIHIDTGINSVI